MRKLAYGVTAALLACALAPAAAGAATLGSTNEGGANSSLGNQVMKLASVDGSTLAPDAVAFATLQSAASVSDVDATWYTNDPGQSVYYISNAAQLRGLAALVNGTAKDAQGRAVSAVNFSGVTIYQANSINLYDGTEASGYKAYEFTPIGTSAHPFAGTFQALNNATINGLYITQQTENAGLFGYASEASKIIGVNLNAGPVGQISATSETARITNIGSVAGYTAGKLQDCYSDMAVKIASTGAALSTEDDQDVVARVGGIAGFALGDISSCGFSGTLDVSVASKVALADDTAESLRVASSIGGVVGRFGDPNQHGTITSCYNTGTVFTRTTGAGSEDRFGVVTWARIFFVGGIAGYSNGSIYDCYNGKFNELTLTTSGTISTSAIDSADASPLDNRGGDQVAGIVGGLRSTTDDPNKYNDGDPNDPMVVARCNNQGHITGAVATAGICGESGVYCTVTECYNGTSGDTSQTAGKVIATRWNKPMSAGVVARTNGGTVSYCANFAEIRNTQTGYYMAGIIGALFTSDDYPVVTPECYGCLNTGSIYTMNTTTGVEYREAGICGENEGNVHDCLTITGSVPYHSDSIIGDDNWGMWSNLEVRSKESLESADSAAYLNGIAARDQEWGCYWFINKSGYPTLNVWASLTDSQRTELVSGTGGNIACVETIEDAPYVGGTGGSVPTLKVTLTDGTVLVQNTDFYVIPQEGAVALTPDSQPYKASIVGLGMYRGEVDNCVNYGITVSKLENANLVVGSMGYNGGKVVFPTFVRALMGRAEIDATQYDYVVYSYHVTRTDVQKGQSGCTVAFDSAGYISYKADGSDMVPVSEVGVDAINAETRAYWLWSRDKELISDSTGAVYYTEASGGGTPGTKYGDDESCTKLRSGTPAGYVVKAQAKSTSEVLTGFALSSYVVNTIDIAFETEFEYATVQGKTWYWDYTQQKFYTVDSKGERVTGMPAATFTGETITATPYMWTTIADGSKYTLKQDTDYRVIDGDPNGEGAANRNVTDYNADTRQRAAITIRPVDTNRFHSYVVGYFAIAPAKLEDCAVSLASSTWAYTGKAIEPEVTVKLNGVTLQKDVDYTVTYANNVNKGEASYTVTALTNLSGGTQQTYTGTFTIGDGYSLDDLTLDAIADQQYNYGADVHPTLTFRDKNGQKVDLVEGDQYTVTYSTTDVTKCTGTNPDGGSIAYQSDPCTITITGVGLCTGQKTSTFNIVPYDAAANTTNQLRATVQTMKRDSWTTETAVPYNMGLNNPVVTVQAYPIVDWAAYAQGDLDKAYGTPITIGCNNSPQNGATINNRPVRYYVYDASKTGGLGALVSADGATIVNPYETGKGTTLATAQAPVNTTLVATVAMRVSTSGKHNGAVGLLKTDAFEVTGPVSFAFEANGGTGTVPALAAAEVGTTVTLPSAASISRSGYTFIGWQCSADGVTYAAGASYTVPKANSVTFTAQWKANTPTPTPTPVVTKVPVYRLYNPVTSEHLWTTDYNEYQVLPTYGWNQENVAWQSPASSATPVYRLYSPGLGTHHYTSDTNEIYALVNQYGWQMDNNSQPMFYSAAATDSGVSAVLRMYNGALSQHLLTMDANEYNTLGGNAATGWSGEGVSFYAYAK